MSKLAKVINFASKIATKKNLVTAGTIGAIALHGKKVSDDKKLRKKADTIRTVAGAAAISLAAQAAVSNRRRLQSKGDNKKGRWITLNGGRRIFIPDGASKDFVKKSMKK